MDTTIYRPGLPQHYMVLRSIVRRIIIRLPDGSLLADTKNAIRLMEAGKTLYDPVVYVPRQDIKVNLLDEVEQTVCPLKGTACYYGCLDQQNHHEKLAWSYLEPSSFAQELTGLVAFYADKVILEQHPI